MFCSLNPLWILKPNLYIIFVYMYTESVIVLYWPDLVAFIELYNSANNILDIHYMRLIYSERC